MFSTTLRLRLRLKRANQRIKQLKLGKYDESVRILIEIETMKGIKGLTYYEIEEYEYIHFNLPIYQFQPQPYVVLNFTDRIWISLGDFMKVASYVSKPQITLSKSIFIKLISLIWNRNLTIQNGIEQLHYDIASFIDSYKRIKNLSHKNEFIYPNFTPDDLPVHPPALDRGGG
jgi:hypothetical protein